ncbi:glycosyltransferase [Halomarina rubra]|uniref:Glycosyltransferase n=1 Tax=Halomarina rubra TaxID=2071873 RepID=A0ABD6AWX1_9EURY|nr:glycosyltransferase [Halomarina rubra]
MANSEVLIVAFHAPPENTSSARRIRCLINNLPNQGWSPTVLTTETETLPSEHYAEYVVQTPYLGDIHEIIRQRLPFLSDEYTPDESPHATMPEDSTNSIGTRLQKKAIHSAKSLVLDSLAYPDSKRLWRKKAVHYGRELLDSGEFDLILSTSPPATSHLIGRQLANEFEIPWVADFQDLWTQYHYNTSNPIREFFESRLQKRVISDADYLTAATAPFAEQLESFHEIPAIPIHLGLEKLETSPLTDDFTITYSGGLYNGKRDPRKILKSIEILETSKSVDPANIVVQFFGVQAPWLKSLVNRYNLDSTVRQTEWLPKQEILKKQRESQILLSIQWDHPMEWMVCPGKIFEYLAAQRPILAYGGPTHGVVGSILNETKAGQKFDSPSKIAEYLENRYHEYESMGEVSYHGETQAINSYRHDKITKKFVKVFNEVQ